MSTDSEMFRKLAPELAPADESVDSHEIGGLWSYGDGEMERLIWTGDDSDIGELESAIETALWLFDDRRDEGDSATISMSDGTVVIERGSESVLAAWYPQSEVGRSAEVAEAESAGLGLDANTEAYDTGIPPDEQDRGSSPPSGSEHRATRPSSLDLGDPPEETGGSGASSDVDTPSSKIGAPTTHDVRDTSQGAHRESQERDLPSSEREESSAQDDDLTFEIAFVDDGSDEGQPQTSSVSRTRECDWGAVVEHLAHLTEIAERHLGQSVVRNYWKEALEGRDRVRDAIEIDLFDGLRASAPEQPVDREAARQLRDVRSDWLDRCRRSVPSEAVSFHDTAKPPWRPMLEPR